jgi:plastocyanin
MKLRCLACAALLFSVACGSDDEQLPIDGAIVIDAAAIDAQVIDAIDALVVDAPIDAPSSVMLIANCTGQPNPDLTISAETGAFVPADPDINVGDVVRFEPGDPNHNMAADNGEFSTPLGQVTCLQFTAAGTFPVHCSIHGFSTTITVTAPL